MTDELTDEEREFLTSWQNGVVGALGLQPTAVDEAEQAAQQAVQAITERWPSRTHRLLVLAALADAVTAARSDVLAEVLESRYQWTPSVHRPGELTALAWQPYEERGLVALSGLSPTTIRARIKAAARRTYEQAQAELAADQ